MSRGFPAPPPCGGGREGAIDYAVKNTGSTASDKNT